MIVSLDIVYHSHFYFLPLRTATGALFGAELITHFVAVDAPVRIPTELVTSNITPEQELTLFHERLALLKSQQDFFKIHKLVILLNISERIIDAILAMPELIAHIKELPFIQLTITGNFYALNLGADNVRLREASKLFPLALTHFGAGAATTKSIYDGLFATVMLDKTFVQKQIQSSSFSPFMLAILAQLSPFCRDMLIAGIDDEAARNKAVSLGFSAMQGNLWPAVSVESLAALLPLA